MDLKNALLTNPTKKFRWKSQKLLLKERKQIQNYELSDKKHIFLQYVPPNT